MSKTYRLIGTEVARNDLQTTLHYQLLSREERPFPLGEVYVNTTCLDHGLFEPTVPSAALRVLDTLVRAIEDDDLILAEAARGLVIHTRAEASEAIAKMDPGASPKWVM